MKQRTAGGRTDLLECQLSTVCCQIQREEEENELRGRVRTVWQFFRSWEWEMDKFARIYCRAPVLSLPGCIIRAFLLDCDSERLSISVVLLSACPLVRDNNPLVSILFLCTVGLHFWSGRHWLSCRIKVHGKNSSNPLELFVCRPGGDMLYWVN